MACAQLLRSTPRVVMACMQADSLLYDCDRDLKLSEGGEEGLVVRGVRVREVKSAAEASMAAATAVKERKRKLNADMLFVFFVGM